MSHTADCRPKQTHTKLTVDQNKHTHTYTPKQTHTPNFGLSATQKESGTNRCITIDGLSNKTKNNPT